MSSPTVTISLAGEWSFALDPQDIGVQKSWFKKELDGVITLPGSIEEHGYGEKLATIDTLRLNRQYRYEGAVWYQHTVEIPEGWKGKKITLFMERCLWETCVWVDDRFAGSEDSLSIAHAYDLSGLLTPGTHQITVRVDNREKYRIGTWGHAYSDDMQTIWNGIIGKIELCARDAVYIESLQTYPEVAGNKVRVVAGIGNISRMKADICLSIDVEPIGKGKPEYRAGVASVINGELLQIETEISMGDEYWLWDEFSPNLYRMQVRLTAKAGELHFQDEQEVTFGMRKFETKGNQFILNGQPVFLRGTLDCGSFPLTGYPAMDIAFWQRIYRIGKEYGLNHFRYHSWCPPEAAFTAADELGIILQVELPFFPLTNKPEEAIFSPEDCVPALGSDPDREQFFRDELDRILNTYGNHPSFCLMCMGNELKGDYSFLGELVARGKQKDGRHLYSSCANNSVEPLVEIGPYPGEEFYVSHAALVEGERSDRRGTNRFNEERPETMSDYGIQQEGIHMPVISHEIGQWLVYPNFEEMDKYTGVLKPLNFQLFKDSLEQSGMGNQAADFVMASGKLSALLYREEIERSLRTPDYGGFQLLDIHDYHGQGSSTIGILDAFWDSKGLMTAEEFRSFCGPLVLLARMKQRVWTNGEIFCAEVEIANYTKIALEDEVVYWQICDTEGNRMDKGSFGNIWSEQGKLTKAGTVSASLTNLTEAIKLVLKLELGNKGISNTYEFWVYPEALSIQIPQEIMVCSRLDTAAQKHLEKGGKLLLLPEGQEAMEDIRFTTVFWNTQLFKKQKKSMGILCDPSHPALAHFPTDSHTNWQWWELLHQARCMVLNDTPSSFSPIIQVIDHPLRNNKEGILFEAKKGQGKLLVCTLPLTKVSESSPVARQLLYSLLQYIRSDRFVPETELPERCWTVFQQEN